MLEPVACLDGNPVRTVEHRRPDDGSNPGPVEQAGHAGGEVGHDVVEV